MEAGLESATVIDSNRRKKDEGRRKSRIGQRDEGRRKNGKRIALGIQS
jgi:hypothetical protein